MDNNKMRFIDYLAALGLFLLAMLAASCSKNNQEVECELEKIKEYAEEHCQTFAENEVCKQEVIYLIGVTCGIS
jgi:hypothetical protein